MNAIGMDDLAQVAEELRAAPTEPATGVRTKLMESPSATARRLVAGDSGDLPEGLLQASASQRWAVMDEAERVAGSMEREGMVLIPVPGGHCARSLSAISSSLGVAAVTCEIEGTKFLARFRDGMDAKEVSV